VISEQLQVTRVMNLYVGGIKIPKHDKGSGVLWSGGNAGAYALIRPMIIDRANAKAIGGLLTGERNHIYFSIEPTMTMVYESISSAGSGGLHTPTMSPQEPLPTPPTPPTPPIPPIPPTPPTTTARRAVSFADEKDEDDEDDHTAAEQSQDTTTKLQETKSTVSAVTNDLVPGKDGTTMDRRCYNCNQMGHMSFNCSKPKRQQANAQTVEQNDNYDPINNTRSNNSSSAVTSNCSFAINSVPSWDQHDNWMNN